MVPPPLPIPTVVHVDRDTIHDQFVVFHASRLSLPIPGGGVTAWVPPHLVRDVRWASDAWFYLMFLPLHDRMNSKFLDIDFTRKTVDLREYAHPNKFGNKDTIYWGMAERHCKHLSAVYKAIQVVIGELTRFANVNLPLFMRQHSTSDAIIWRVFEQPHEAVAHALQQRSIVYSQLALASYCVTLCVGEADYEGRARPLYLDYLTSKAQDRDDLPPSFIEALADTWVCDLTQPRVGAYVDMHLPMDITTLEFNSTTWTSTLPRILRYATRLPIALYYPGDKPLDQRACPTAFKYRPDPVIHMMPRPGPAFGAPPPLAFPPCSPIPPTPFASQSSPIPPSPFASHSSPTPPPPFVSQFSPTSPSPSPSSSSSPPFDPKKFETYGPKACRTMSFVEWMAKLQRWTEWSIARETPARRELRLRREVENAEQPIPKKGGPSVFEWVLAGGIWSCQCVSQRGTALKDLWSVTNPLQRYYNSSLHQWHISQDVNEDETPQGVIPPNAYDDDDDDDEGYGYDLPDEPPQRVPLHVDAVEARTAQRVSSDRSRSPVPRLAHRHRDDPAMDVDQPQLQRPSTASGSSAVSTITAVQPDPAPNNLHQELLDMVIPDDVFLYTPPDSMADFVRLRLGFCVPNPEIFDPRAGDELLVPRKAQQGLGFREKHDTNLTEHAWLTLALLFKWLGVPREADDLRNGTIAGADSLFLILDTHPHTAAPLIATPDRGRSSFLISPKSSNNQDFYVLRRRGLPETAVPWSIVLEDPLTALEVVRRGWGPYTVDVARELCARGIPFHTVVRCEKSLPAVPKHRQRLGLGLFNKGYKPNEHDYAAYEARLQELLQQRGFLRAVLLKGGIVWRLALAVLGFDDIIGGPSMEALNPYVIELDSEWFLDDDLTYEELDIICGVCRIRTGTSGSDASLSSWWPRHDTWMKSNYNDGHWSWRDEVWFRDRLEKIRSGTASVRRAGDWKSSIKGEAEWGRLQSNLKTFARNFIFKSFADA